MDQLTKSCLSYLSEHKILCKLMEGFTEKYRSFGTVCGNVTLTRLREEDIEILEGFFGKSFHGKKKTTISASTVSKAIANSCYAGCDLNDIVCAFQSEQLLTHKEMKEKYQLEQKQFFEKILEKHHDTVFAQWLKKVLRTKDAPFSYLVKQYNVNKDLLEKQCNWIAKALNYLPVERDRYEYLAIFATNIMGDPHGFDEGTTNMLLLRYGILFYIDKTEKISNDFEQNSIQQGIGDKGEIVGRSNENCYLPIKHVNKLSAEEKQELLFRVGILKDDISNQVMVYGVQAEKKDGKLHLGVQGFYEENELCMISLLTLTSLQRCIADGNRVYVVENPIVFARIIELVKGMKKHQRADRIDAVTMIPEHQMTGEKFGVLCVNGQPNLATLVMLDKLAKNHTEFHYAGDFDPEGLMIAQRLKNRYGEQLKLWHYGVKDYEKSMSQKTVDQTRMKMLEHVTDSDLMTIGTCIRNSGMAGYQESLLDEYLKDLGYCSRSTMHLLHSTYENDELVQKSYCRRQF